MAEIDKTKVNISGSVQQPVQNTTSTTQTTSSTVVPVGQSSSQKVQLTPEILQTLLKAGYTNDQIATMSEVELTKLVQQIEQHFKTLTTATIPTTVTTETTSSLQDELIVDGQDSATKETLSNAKILSAISVKPDKKAADKTKNGDEIFDFQSFKNETDFNKKAKILLEEFTKNKYNNSENKPTKAWDSLSDEEKQNLENNITKSLLKKYNKSGKNISISKIIDVLKNPKNKVKSPHDLRMYSSQMDTFMSDIQAANQNSMDYEGYKKQPKEIRNAQKYEMLKLAIKNGDAKASLSRSDYIFYQNENMLNEAGCKFFNKKEITNSNIRDRIKEYNQTHPDNPISEASIEFDYLKDKQEKTGKLSGLERKTYESYSRLKNAGADLNKIPNYDSSNTTFNKMMEDPVYQKAIASGKTTREAEIAYLNDQLKAGEGKALDPEEFEKRFTALLEGCSQEGATELMSVAAEMKQRNYIVFANQNIAVNNKAVVSGADTVDGKSLDTSIKQGKIDNTWAKVVDNMALDDRNWNRVRDLHRNCSDTIDGSYDRARERGVSDADWDSQVADDYPKNRDKYSNESSAAILDEGGNYVSKDHQSEYIDNVSHMIADNKNTNDYEHFAGSAHTYDSANQTKVANSVMSLAGNFSKSDAVNALNALADDIQNCDKSNQLAMHKLIMSSSYSEVQVRAASNINKYDASVQADAFKATLATGNSEAIEAATSQYRYMAPSAQKATEKEYNEAVKALESRFTSDVIEGIVDADEKLKSGTKSKFESALISKYDDYKNGKCTLNDLMNAFLNASNKDRYAMIKPLLEKGAIPMDTLKLLVKYCPTLLLSLIDTFVENGKGQEILNVFGKTPELTQKVINLMMQKGNMSDKKASASYILDNPSEFSKDDREKALTTLSDAGMNIHISYKTDEDVSFLQKHKRKSKKENKPTTYNTVV